MEDRVSAKEIKKIIKEITDSESMKYGIDIKLCPLSFVDIVNPSFIKGTKYTLLRRVNDYIEYLHYNGYNEKGSAVVFVDRIVDTRIRSNLKDLGKLYANEVRYDLAQQYNKALGRDTEYLRRIAERGNGYFNKYDGAFARGLFQVLKTSYHEIRHSVQLTFDRYSYERFLCDIENFFIMCNLGRDYKHNHDSYSFEIGANLYGTRMAKEYLMNNYPLIYEKDKVVIEAIEKRYMNDLSSEEVQMIMDAMDYTNDLCMMQMKFYDEVVEYRKATEGYFKRQIMKTTYLRLYAGKHKYVKRYLNSFEKNIKLVEGKSR